jgi:RNA polymerase sigma-70 factor (ECF subfamily)
VRTRHDALVRFFTLRTGSREEAKDLVQCAYVKVLGVGHPERIRDLEGYVWRSAFNLTTDRRRRRAVREDYTRYAVSESADLVHSIETELETRERMELVARIHETLSPRCRTAFALRMLEDRPFKDVGRAMGISDRMAKIYVARARVSIQDALDRAEQPAARAAQPPSPVESGRRATPFG